jgi:hypothetical protein
MLSKQNLRALRPGQWARVKVPDYELWREPKRFSRLKPGDLVDICLMPRYEPRYSYPNCFEWYYSVAHRLPGSDDVRKEGPDDCRIGTWEFGLIDATRNGPNWDEEVSRAAWQGKGTYLYEPASEDPELCPGGDWSRYECDICKQFVKPFSNDDGDLICPWCEATGLIILDDEQLDRLEQVREFARSIGLSRQLERQLDFLANYANHDDSPKRQCVLSYDFAPYSFSFAHFALPTPEQEKPQRKFWFNGGLIYQGPRHPADGSFPSLTVSLTPGTGWFCHT